MIVRILGSAAGGGVPQWNCGCANCAAARRGDQPRRLESTVAIGEGERWLLLNCSPDIAAQIQCFPSLHPSEKRGTPIAGMCFTDANVDHLGGLAVLRQRGNHRFIVRSSSVVRDIAVAQPAFAPFAQPPHRWLDVAFETPCLPASDDDVVGREFDVRAFAVPGLTPGYAGRQNICGAVVAYEIRGNGNGKTLLFAPVFSAIDDRLRAAIERADVALLDGSFYSDDELIREHMMQKTARRLGHHPVGGPHGTLAQLQGMRTRAIFTHVNNSNPMLDPRSAQAHEVAAAGASIAYDGMEFTL